MPFWTPLKTFPEEHQGNVDGLFGSALPSLESEKIEDAPMLSVSIVYWQHGAYPISGVTIPVVRSARRLD